METQISAPKKHPFFDKHTVLGTIVLIIFAYIFVSFPATIVTMIASMILPIGDYNNYLFIGIAIMCYLPVAVFIVPFFFVFVTYKSYHWRDFIVAILGITAPAIILFTYAFLTDKLDYYFILIRHDILNVGLYISSQGVADIVKNIIFILILLWALLSQISTLNDSTIQQRINTVLFILPLLGAILMLPYDKLFTIDTQPTALVFAFIGSNLLAADRKHAWINEVLFWIIIITPIVVN